MGVVTGDSGSGCGTARLCHDVYDNDATYDAIYDNHAIGYNHHAPSYDYTAGNNDNTAGDNHAADDDNSARPRCQNNNDGWL
jgi:hypothetical protein